MSIVDGWTVMTLMLSALCANIPTAVVILHGDCGIYICFIHLLHDCLALFAALPAVGVRE